MNNDDKTKKLKEIIKSVSKGTIVNKKIKGKDYFYYQYYSLGYTKSFYIPDSSVKEIREELDFWIDEKRKKEEKIKRSRNLVSLSKNAKELSGYVMMANTPCALFIKGELKNINEDICPLLIKRTHNIFLFLSSRAIDADRTNARLLKKALNIKEDEDYLISQYAYGATITDNYWFKPLFSKLRYEDIMFDNDFYGDLALNGSFNALPKYGKHTPQLTLTGSFEKCWKKEDGDWWLYKKGSKENNFAELFVCELSQRLNISTAIYRCENGIVKTKNFAKEYNFEPMMAIASEDDSYENVYNALKAYSKKIRKDYLKLIYLDTLVFNVDRHNENMGLLRDRKSGEVLSLAPNFDNNLSLNANGKDLNSLTNKDSLITLFIKFISNNEEARDLFNEIDIKEINKDLLKSILDSIDLDYKPQEVINFVLTRYRYLKKRLNV